MSPARAAVNLPVPYLEQPDDQTCLPTCLTMALHFMGREPLTTQTVYRFHPRTNYDRYNLPGMLKEYGLFGLPSWYELGWTKETVKRELDAGRPVILGCNQGRYGHFVLAVGYTADDRVILNDPTGPSPGYPLGGDHAAYRWDELLWRGGCIIRPGPFPDPPPTSARVLQTTFPKRMLAGETAEAVVAVQNNGREIWPGHAVLAPVNPFAPISETTAPKHRRSPFYDEASWISPTQAVAADREQIATSETALFKFKLRAPNVSRDTTFKETWNIVDGNGRWFSDSWLAGPGDWQIAPTIVVSPKREWNLPMAEKPEGGKPSLPWQVKFGALTAMPESPDTPKTTESALQLLTPGHNHDAAWVGDATWADYRVEVMVYCDYRPGIEKKGWDRVGLFVRDNGQHCGDTKSMTESGECYAMTYDSDDGSVRAASILNGGVEDFRRGPRLRVRESGWHRFTIECRGNTIRYELDGTEFHVAKDRTLKNGECGVYYRTAFNDPALARGIRFADFRVDP